MECRWRAAIFTYSRHSWPLSSEGSSHRPTFYNGHFRGSVTLTPNAECLAVELSLPLITSRLRSLTEPRSLACGANALRLSHRGGLACRNKRHNHGGSLYKTRFPSQLKQWPNITLHPLVSLMNISIWHHLLENRNMKCVELLWRVLRQTVRRIMLWIDINAKSSLLVHVREIRVQKNVFSLTYKPTVPSD